MSEHHLANEVLQSGPEPKMDYCMGCGEETTVLWLGFLSFCSHECLEKYADEWNAEWEREFSSIQYTAEEARR